MTNIIENYKHVVLNNYTTFDGRARRREFWLFILASFIISIVLGMLDSALSPMLGLDPDFVEESGGVLSGIYSILVLIPSIAVGIRRMHDINKSGWWMLIPLYNIYLWAQPGTEGANRFGADPKGTDVRPIPTAAAATVAPVMTTDSAATASTNDSAADAGSFASSSDSGGEGGSSN
ncbi:MAG TPA: DUF805 domain-containing protein [Candidatus Paceibacterota bacterium]